MCIPQSAISNINCIIVLLPVGQKRLTVTLKEHEIVDIITGDSLNNLGNVCYYLLIDDIDKKNCWLNYM